MDAIKNESRTQTQSKVIIRQAKRKRARERKSVCEWALKAHTSWARYESTFCTQTRHVRVTEREQGKRELAGKKSNQQSAVVELIIEPAWWVCVIHKVVLLEFVCTWCQCWLQEKACCFFYLLLLLLLVLRNASSACGRAFLNSRLKTHHQPFQWAATAAAASSADKRRLRVCKKNRKAQIRAKWNSLSLSLLNCARSKCHIRFTLIGAALTKKLHTHTNTHNDCRPAHTTHRALMQLSNWFTLLNNPAAYDDRDDDYDDDDDEADHKLMVWAARLTFFSFSLALFCSVLKWNLTQICCIMSVAPIWLVVFVALLKTAAVQLLQPNVCSERFLFTTIALSVYVYVCECNFLCHAHRWVFTIGGWNFFETQMCARWQQQQQLMEQSDRSAASRALD